KSLDDGLIQLMADEDVLTLLKFVPRFKGVKVYIEADVPLIEQDMMKVRSGQAKGVVIEQIVKDDRVEKLLLLECNGENVGIAYSDDEFLHSQYHKKCLVTTDSLTISQKVFSNQ
ncbi:hypothetical protein Tco_0186021, partial [Tanacetum coccineum]